MLQLLINEFQKIRRTKVFYISFLVMLLAPMFSIILMSIESTKLVIGDFNGVNILLLSLIGSRTIFPAVAMYLVKLEYDFAGFKSNFVTPISRTKLMFSKVLLALIWMILMIVFSILIVILLEIVLFKELEITMTIMSSLKNYLLIIVYTLPIQIFAMLLTFLLKNVIIPLLLISTYAVVEYIFIIIGDVGFTPTILPAFISGNMDFSLNVSYAFWIIFAFGCASLFLLYYFVENRDFIN